jgi:hypothetical protein
MSTEKNAAEIVLHELLFILNCFKERTPLSVLFLINQLRYFGTFEGMTVIIFVKRCLRNLCIISCKCENVSFFHIPSVKNSLCYNLFNCYDMKKLVFIYFENLTTTTDCSIVLAFSYLLCFLISNSSPFIIFDL